MKNDNQINLKNFLFDFGIGIILLVIFYPIAQKFYFANPPMGLDFYQFPTYVRYLTDNFTLPPLSWKYIWFDGVPLITDYSCLFFYLAIPFAKIWGLVFGSKILLLVASYLYFWFAYLFLKELAKNRWFALAVTTALVWTTNYYSPLFSGGNATYAATQFFLSLTLWLAVKYGQTNKREYFSLLVFFAGLSYWGHAGTALIFVWVPVLFFLLFGWDEEKKFLSWQKIKDIIYYVIFSMAIGFLPLYGIVYLVLTIPKAADFNFFQAGGLKHLEAIKGLFLTQNFFMVAGAVILFILAMVVIKPKHGRKFASFLSLAVYIFAFEWLYVIGRNPFAGGIMPPRTFWFFTLVIAGLSALSWDVVFNKENKTSKVLGVLMIVIFFLSPLCLLVDLNKLVFKAHLNDTGVATNFRDYAVAQNTLVKKILGNSFQAETIDFDRWLAQKNLKSVDFERLKGILLPEWLPVDDLKYRFHTLEVGVNIWWSLPFNLPITHGSYNSAHLESNNYAYWTDMAFHGELTTHWNHPLEIAKNDLLFLIDWRGIRYLLGNEVEVKEGTEYSLGGSIADPSSLAAFLTQDPDLVDRRGLKDLPVSLNPEISPNNFDFFRINEKITSPIIKTTNSPTILVIGESQTAYDNLIRNLGHLNLNSRYLIPVKGGDNLEKLTLNELKKFDLVFLQYYQSTPQAWEILKKYVEEGGKVVIETGSEVKESDSKSLPLIFPVSQTTRESLGNAWDLTYLTENPLLKQVNVDEFGPLIYNNEPWKISHSEPSSVRNWAKVVMSQKQKPIMVVGNLGKGKVVWSGLNLSYHFNQYMSLAEGQLIKNILGSMLDLKDEGILNFTFERPNPEKITVSGNNFRGVMLKENNYGGWHAEMISPYKKSLTVYNAGLGYVYIQLPEKVSGQVKVKIEYKGTKFIWFFFILAVVISLWLIMKSIVGDHRLAILGKIDLKEKMMTWWYKDD